MTRIVGPLKCLTCAALVSWLRENGKYRLVNHKTNEPHVCERNDCGDLGGLRWPAGRDLSMSWITLDTKLGNHPKMAALPSDAARYGWVLTLLEAKEQRTPGTFASEKHYRHVMPRHGRFLADYVKAGLIDKGEDGTLHVHDWQRHQWSVSKAKQRGQNEDIDETSEGQKEDASRAVGVSVPVDVLETTEGVQGEPNDPWTLYRALTRSAALNPNVIAWLTRLEDEYGALTVCAHLSAAFQDDPSPKTLLSRTEQHIQDRKRQIAKINSRAKRSNRITEQMEARRLELYRNTGKWDPAWGDPPVAA